MTRQSMWDEWLKTDEGRAVTKDAVTIISKLRRAFDAGILAAQEGETQVLDRINARSVGSFRIYRETLVFEEAWIMPIPPERQNGPYTHSLLARDGETIGWLAPAKGPTYKDMHRITLYSPWKCRDRVIDLKVKP
jgi:hypothetical protein